MIKVTKLNKEAIYINPALIEIIEKTPDTLITLITGKKIIVSEPIEELRDNIIEYFKVVGMIAPQIIFNSLGMSRSDN